MANSVSEWWSRIAKRYERCPDTVASEDSLKNVSLVDEKKHFESWKFENAAALIQNGILIDFEKLQKTSRKKRFS